MSDLFVTTIGSTNGQATISRLGPGGRITTVWGRSNAFPTAISPSGDSILAFVEHANGKSRSMILPAAGGPGRVILNPGDVATFWSRDGTTLAYQATVDGAGDIDIFNVADGTVKRLTTTPEDEGGAELTPDGKTVVFNRSRAAQRIYSANLEKIFGGRKQEDALRAGERAFSESPASVRRHRKSAVFARATRTLDGRPGTVHEK